MNYVWRTNDIVYLDDSPRGRPGGQYLPRPLWEKNGSLDAFRYFAHEATGGSDHVCFNNPSVGVPGIELFTWPDQWYHADTDTPDKSDPTQMKRVAFIGAAAAWAAANCDDDVLPRLLEAVSAFGYARVGRRELPRAMQLIADAGAEELGKARDRALDLIAFATDREKTAIESVREVYTGSARARAVLTDHIRPWEIYGAALARQVRAFAALRARTLGTRAPAGRALSGAEARAGAAVPALAPGIRGREFTLEGSERYKKYVEAHPEAVKALKLTPAQRRAVLDFIDGRRPATLVRRGAEIETATEIAFPDLMAFLAFLDEVGWIAWPPD
jgi:Peptidase family M28